MNHRHLSIFLASFSLLISALAENPAGIPPHYRLVYSQDFTGAEALKDFTFTDAGAWKIGNMNGKPALELTRQSKYTPPFRSPVNLALLNGHTFGDVIFEAECMQTGHEYGHRDMVFIYGYQSPSKFYYTHLATTPDPHAHNCFIVNEAARVKFAGEVNSGVNWGLGVSHKVRIERKASDGTVRVFFDDMTRPVMSGTEKTFVTGRIGFGSFDDTGMLTGIKVWAPAEAGPQAVTPR